MEKTHQFSKKPSKPNKFLMWLIRTFSINPVMKMRKFSCEKIGMDDIKPPYFLLSNHGSKMDFRLIFSAIAPYDINYVVSNNVVQTHGQLYAYASGGIITRRFIVDMSMIKNMKYCIDNHNLPLAIMPEARYSFDGTPNPVPKAVAKMAKLLKVPVVLHIGHGAYLSRPQWSKRHGFNKLPLKSELICIVDNEEIKKLTANEIDERIQKYFIYDDYKYQRENNIKIKYRKRAEGLNHILYQCCECGTEHQMTSKGKHLFCSSCNKKWELTELGLLKGCGFESKFSFIPDWVKWEREQIKNQIRGGTYSISCDINVHTLPKNKYIYQGVGKFWQDMDGTHFTCNYFGKPYEMHISPTELSAMHIEFAYDNKRLFKGLGDCMDISKLDDSFWLSPINVRNLVMKISLATEELYNFAIENLRKS